MREETVEELVKEVLGLQELEFRYDLPFSHGRVAVVSLGTFSKSIYVRLNSTKMTAGLHFSVSLQFQEEHHVTEEYVHQVMNSLHKKVLVYYQKVKDWRGLNLTQVQIPNDLHMGVCSLGKDALHFNDSVAFRDEDELIKILKFMKQYVA